MLLTGAEILLESGLERLRGRKIGVLCNPSALVRTAVPPYRRCHLVDALQGAGLDLVRLYGPEHGLWSTAQDLIAVDGGRDPVFGLDVTTLYGRSEDSLTLRSDALDGVEILIADLQDVGARYYTYAATICMALQACQQRGVELLLLDRPNPLGGEAVEGNQVQQKYMSFVGYIDVPQRHGLTLGELVALYAGEAGLQNALTVVPCQNWDTALYMDEQDWGPAGTPWYAPSPNMPTVATAVVYPGGCLIEATRLSEGRGTTRPFELIGASWLDARAYARALEAMEIPGMSVRPMCFEPTFQKFAGLVCGGVAVEVSDRRIFPAVRSGLALIAAAMRLGPRNFAWRTETYEFVSDRLAMDLLMGKTLAREVLEAGGSLDDATADFAADTAVFAARARPYLLYPRHTGVLAHQP